MPQSTQVPQVFPVRIGTHEYAVDESKLQRRFLPSQRTSVDQQQTPGEQSLNTEGAWIRSQTDWSLGGQQEVFDDEDASPRRFYREKDVQAVRRGRIQLSNALQQKSATIGGCEAVTWTERRMIQVGTSIYFWELTGATYTLHRAVISTGPYAGLTAFLPISSATPITCLATDGTNTTWAARGGSGVSRETTVGGGWTAAWSAVATNIVAYCNGRLLGMAGAEVFELDSGGLKITIWTHGNTSWVWQGAVAGSGGIYVWGETGVESNVYVISDVISGGALAPPKIALPMPPGETVHHMEPVSGLFVARTSLGVRVFYPQGDGSLTSGPLITMRDDPATDYPALPLCISAYADGVLVGWRDTSIQPDWIARLDLSNFVNDAPAMHQGEYTADEAETTVANQAVGALKVANYNGSQYQSGQLWVIGGDTGVTTRRLWAAAIAFAPNGDFAARQKSTTGYFYTGWITYGLTETKQPLSVKLVHEAIPTGASIGVYWVQPNGTETLLGTTTAGTTATEIAVDTTTITPQREFQLKFLFTRGTTDSATPVLRSWALRAYPIPTAQEEIILPIMMQEVVRGRNRHPFSQQALTEWNYLAGLKRTRTPVDLIEGGSVTTKVIVDDIIMPQGEITGLARRRVATPWWEGTWYVRLISAV